MKYLKNIVIIFTTCVAMIFTTGCVVDVTTDNSNQSVVETTTSASNNKSKEKVILNTKTLKITLQEFIEYKNLENCIYFVPYIENKTKNKVMVFFDDVYANDTKTTILGGPGDILGNKKSQAPYMFTGFKYKDLKKLEFKIKVSWNDGDFKTVKTVKINPQNFKYEELI